MMVNSCFWTKMSRLLLLVSVLPVVPGRKPRVPDHGDDYYRDCGFDHAHKCKVGEEVIKSFGSSCQKHGDGEDMVKSQDWQSEVRMVWPTHIEVMNLTRYEDDGPEPEGPVFRKRISEAVISGWKRFRDDVWPNTTKGHPMHAFTKQNTSSAFNDAFFHWQKNHFEADEDSIIDGSSPVKDMHASNTTWPELDALPEYRRLRQYVAKLGMRYLIRSGVDKQSLQDTPYSIFNWAAVSRTGEFHGPHTHMGEYFVAVFYAQSSPGAGAFRISDPRGHSFPFGRQKMIEALPGQLIFFPPWLGHMATASSLEDGDDDEENLRVIISFNVGPDIGPMPPHFWHKDPTSVMDFAFKSNVEEKFTKFSGKPRDARKKHGIQSIFERILSKIVIKIQNRALPKFQISLLESEIKF
jgi:hypothetical protein